MFSFDWTLNVGTLLSLLGLLLSMLFAWWRVVANHLEYFQSEVGKRFDKVDADIREIRGFVFPPRTR